MTYSSVYQFFFKMYFALSLFGCHGKSAIGTWLANVMQWPQNKLVVKYAGMVTLSPMMVAPVCRVGDPLQITCTASVNFIKLSIVVLNEQGMAEEINVIRNSDDPSPPPKQRIINSTTFTFTRTSAQGDSPLIFTLSIDSVNISLNGTVVNCMDANNPMTLESASTIIQIIDTSNSKFAIQLSYPSNCIVWTIIIIVILAANIDLNISTIIEEYGADNVTVSVNWAQQVGVTYTARISPLAPISSTGSNSRQLKLSYNTAYNLSVVAVTPCGTTMVAFIGLHYGEV